MLIIVRSVSVIIVFRSVKFFCCVGISGLFWVCRGVVEVVVYVLCVYDGFVIFCLGKFCLLCNVLVVE